MKWLFDGDVFGTGIVFVFWTLGLQCFVNYFQPTNVLRRCNSFVKSNFKV